MSETDVAPRFVDSNVWLYPLIEGQDEQKSNIARALIKEREPVVSSQVVNEVCESAQKACVYRAGGP